VNRAEADGWLLPVVNAWSSDAERDEVEVQEVDNIE
jgi:hypothetical protein